MNFHAYLSSLVSVSVIAGVLLWQPNDVLFATTSLMVVVVVAVVLNFIVVLGDAWSLMPSHWSSTVLIFLILLLLSISLLLLAGRPSLLLVNTAPLGQQRSEKQLLSSYCQ